MKMNIFALLGLPIALISAVAGDAPAAQSGPGCNFWTKLSNNLSHVHEKTTDMLHMQCVSNTCSQMECSGRFHMSNLLDIKTTDFAFCYGLRLNHCDTPISMDYYIEVPSQNLSRAGKLTHSDTLELPGPQAMGTRITLVLKTEMVRKNASYIEFGVTGSVMMGNIPGFGDVQVFPPTLIDTPPCSDNSSGTSRPAFKAPDTCTPTHFVPQTTAVTKPVVVNSKTYNQACEIGLTKCSTNEMCSVLRNNSKARNGICKCASVQGIAFSAETGKCERTGSTSTAAHTTTASPSVTQASKETKKKSSKPSKSSSLTIIIPCVVGGVFLIVVIASVIVYIGRRRRLSVMRGHHLLADDNDDDDDNLVI